MAVQIDQNDVTQAEEFLTAYLTEAIPDADFGPGSAVRDICITSMAHIFAILRKELSSIKARQSLMSLAAMPVDDDVDEAVDSILSNFFVFRKTGLPAKVTATLRFTQPVNAVIRDNTRFIRADGTVFLTASGTAITLLASDMVPRALDTQTTVYEIDVLLRAQDAGAAGNVAPGTFASVDAFNTQFIEAVTTESASGGMERESTEALLNRAPMMLSTRDLVSAKAIANTLLEGIEPLTAVTVVGMGDPEMQRDLVNTREDSLRIHTGGMVDVYCKLPKAPKVVRLTVGARYARPDKGNVVLRDTTVNFLALGVKADDVVKVTSGFTEIGPPTYVVTGVAQHELTVQERIPFPQATDETDAYVTYSVGRYSPNFNSILTSRSTGQTSRSVEQNSVVVLPGGAVYDIRQVWSYGQNTMYTSRVNRTPVTAGEYSVVVPDSTEGQSLRSLTLLYLPTVSDGTEVDVFYDSVEGLDLVQGQLSDPAEKVALADHLARAYHPVYVSTSLGYSVRLGDVDPGIETLTQAVLNYIENTADRDLSVGDMIAQLARQFPSLLNITPTYLDYRLLAPDGQVFRYTTSDVITIAPTQTSGAQFTGASELRSVTSLDLPSYLANCSLEWTDENSAARTEADARLAGYLASQGVSTRTVRYLSNYNNISVYVR